MDILKAVQARAAAESQKPLLPPFDSNLSMRAMVVRQGIDRLRNELMKLTPAECIAIEIELSTRYHDNPTLAHEKIVFGDHAELAGGILRRLPQDTR